MNSLPILENIASWWNGELPVFRIWICVIAALVVIMLVVVIHGVREDRRRKARMQRFEEREAALKNQPARSGRVSDALDELDRVKVVETVAAPVTVKADAPRAAMDYLDEFDIWEEELRNELASRVSEKNDNIPSVIQKPEEPKAAARAKQEGPQPAKPKAEEPSEQEAEVPAKPEPTQKAPPKAEEPAERKAKKTAKDEAADTENTEPDLPVKAAEDSANKGEPVISVQNVTMLFHVATSNVSGLKEYVIQTFKRQISHRDLLALNNVSFDVFKGEVVGVIGTNGSGKSTLLRIVSGALRPTSGQVVVDHQKVQLLTLGTGFDQELTAKENVYLNGAIIGYSREFLDEHYDEIVEFAELQDFMEEKVKNFSSGMVSRLGFAIATAGGAAEILILDEILSVGDEFFRKKSLARIRQMIHGGSTVLMVSHSMPTILANCSKVVWIEKGVLKMIGDPKTVCDAYRKMNDQ